MGFPDPPKVRPLCPCPPCRGQFPLHRLEIDPMPATQPTKTAATPDRTRLLFAAPMLGAALSGIAAIAEILAQKRILADDEDTDIAAVVTDQREIALLGAVYALAVQSTRSLEIIIGEHGEDAMCWGNEWTVTGGAA